MSMLQWIDDFPKQVVKAVEIARQAGIKKTAGIDRVHITGLGGSGIGGTIAAGFAFTQSAIPVTVSKGYSLPAWVNNRTLVIACSYSGNTEETIHAFELAHKAGSTLVCITSGGELEKLGKQKNATVITIPGGFPPRTCLGYSLVQLLKVLEVYGCIATGIENHLLAAARLLENEKTNIQKEAKELAIFFKDKLPVLYASDSYAGVIERWKQQLNENSKVLCYFHVVPEMNHNEMVGWRDGNENTAVLFFKSDDDDKRNVKRMEICEDVISKYTPALREHHLKGENRLEKTLYSIYVGDWVSLYLAEMRGMDPVEIKVIELLKSRLAE